MKNDKINNLESLARQEFLSENKFIPPLKWENNIIADIKRRERTGKFNIQAQALLQTILIWRFAVASLSLAVICFTLYLTLIGNTSNDYQTNEVLFDNFDNYIEMIEQP